MDESLQRLAAAVVDGRCRTPRYIQHQLRVLHDDLVSSTGRLHQAIQKDTGCSSGEAWFEIHMTIQAVKRQYGTMILGKCLENEYRIANGKSNGSRRVPIGCVHIVPFHHSRLYSAIQPAAAAIAAGNCVVIEVRLLQ